MITVAILTAGAGNIQELKAPKEGGVPAKLSPEDKAQLIEFFRVKKIFGSRVWPGLGEAGIPLIQYNARYEFLIAHPGPAGSRRSCVMKTSGWRICFRLQSILLPLQGKNINCSLC